ncbi:MULTISPECIES: hypothetical protein [unclassified Anabaena]|uniref:hypothetical protein n=1 Tax=unclassified Anabaena TaxID=2619674 RepID=UPI0039C5E79D
MLIFILAAGYLFTVYLLLALAKRTGQKSAPRNLSTINPGKYKQDVSANSHVSNVSEAVNSQ